MLSFLEACFHSSLQLISSFNHFLGSPHVVNLPPFLQISSPSTVSCCLCPLDLCNMSASVEQWPPIETTDENLPEQFSGLLTWVLTELTGDEPYDEDLEDQFSLRREVDTTVCKGE